MFYVTWNSRNMLNHLQYIISVIRTREDIALPGYFWFQSRNEHPMQVHHCQGWGCKSVTIDYYIIMHYDMINYYLQYLMLRHLNNNIMVYYFMIYNYINSMNVNKYI